MIVVSISSFRAGLLWILLMAPILIVITLFISENKKGIIIKAASIILLSAGLAIFTIKSENAAVEHRYHALIDILTGNHEFQDGSINARVDAAKLSLRMVKQNFWRGTGFGGFAQEFEGDKTGLVNKYPHNIVVEVFVELGVIYGGVFCIMIIYAIYRIAKKREMIYLILFLTVLWLSMFSKHLSTNAGVLMGVVGSWFLVLGSEFRGENSGREFGKVKELKIKSE
jgi:O-antigen ligase